MVFAISKVRRCVPIYSLVDRPMHLILQGLQVILQPSISDCYRWKIQPTFVNLMSKKPLILKAIAGLTFIAGPKGTATGRPLTMSASANADKAVIKISGYIGGYRANSYDLSREIDDLIDRGIVDVDVYLNTEGGSVFEGNEIVNDLKKFTGTKTAYIGALCASAGTIIACSCDKVVIAKNGTYMVHRPMIMTDGNEDDIESALKLLRSLQRTFLKVYAEFTGKEESYIEAKWKNDWWMNAEEAKAEGFVHEIEGEAEIDPEEASAVLEMYETAPDVFKVAASAKPKPRTQTTQEQDESNQLPMKREELIAALGLPATASDDDIKKALKAQKQAADKVEDLERERQSRLEAEAKHKAQALVDQAEKEKKITAAGKEFWLRAATNDYDGTKAELDARPAVRKIETKGGGDTPTATGDRKDWSYEDWADKDPENFKAMMDKDHEQHSVFASLYKDRYGEEFKA